MKEIKRDVYLNKIIEKRENGLIKIITGIRRCGKSYLLDPPFEKSSLNPGYIKSYMPGVRENGGQYRHECCC